MILFLGLALAGFSQQINTKIDEAKEIKAKTLIVGLPVIDESLLKSLSTDSPVLVVKYKMEIEGKRTYLKRAVKEYWKFSNNVKILDMPEAKELFNSDKDSYAFMYLNESTGDRDFTFKNGDDGYGTVGYVRTNILEYNYNSRYDLRQLVVTPLIIKTKRQCFEMLLPRKCSSYFDFVYTIQRSQYELSKLIDSGNAKLSMLYSKFPADQLKKKTLMIDQNDIYNSITEEELTKIYPYPVKIVNIKEIESAILKGDSTIAVLYLVPCSATNTEEILFNAATGCVYYIQDRGTYYIGQEFSHGTALFSHNKVDALNLKSIAREIVHLNQ